jgi:[acyl-carrier-protein] S-malonyltransferase
MSMAKKRIVVVCPGRGSYLKETLGYLQPHRERLKSFIEDLDQRRLKDGFLTITELDSSSHFSPQIHTKGENASTLIYACSYADFTALDPSVYEIVAIAGNSMGWYITLALGESLDQAGAYQVINTMGSMMKDKTIGGQIIYPLIKENWQRDPLKEELVHQIIHAAQDAPGVEVHPSIFLGGYVVLGANDLGLNYLMKALPPIEHFPFQLLNHAAFHTPLLNEVSQRARERIPENLFHPPKVPLIDGRGHIWKPYSTDVKELCHYTLHQQVIEPYSLTASIEVALKEYNPDHLVLLGPGNTLGGAIGQILVNMRWDGIMDKQSFTLQQKTNPFLISLGIK